MQVSRDRRFTNEHESWLSQLGSYVMRHKDEFEVLGYTVKEIGFSSKFDEVQLTW